jgi:hypothetical protein
MQVQSRQADLDKSLSEGIDDLDSENEAHKSQAYQNVGGVWQLCDHLVHSWGNVSHPA